MEASLGSVPNRPARGQARTPARRGGPLPWLKPGIFIGGLAPLVSVGLRAAQGTLSANPVAQIENELGLAALVFLVASLACTPAVRVFGWTWPTRVRRELGLFAFFYAVLHFATYLALDLGFDWYTVFGDIAKRPFITVGFLAFVLMVPLALTSTGAAVRRLGFRRWQILHRLAYLAGILAVVHFVWRVKIDVSQPLTYAAIVGLLLLARIWFSERRSTTRRGK